jgi:hypothetical protein
MVVWTPRFASECDLPALLGTLQDSFSIVCAYRCQVADALRYRVRDIVDICGIPATDAQNLRDLLGAQAERPMRMPAQIAAASIAAAPARGNAMLARSALSLTATLAIAGAVSPIVIERAAATSRVDATSSSQELLTNGGRCGCVRRKRRSALKCALARFAGAVAGHGFRAGGRACAAAGVV